MHGDTTTETELGCEAVAAMRAVAEAVGLARAVEREVATGALAKDDASPVTLADFSVQALVAARLGRDFPADPLVAEEDASRLRDVPELSSRVADVVRQIDPGLDFGAVL